MTRSSRIREQLISSFRAELTEHLQTMTDGLLALEQGRVAADQRQATMENIFRAAHSLKGAARAVNVTVVEQLAHSLETVLDGVQRQLIEPTSELYTLCYRALDAVQAVQAAYEAGQTTPPLEVLVVMADLEAFRNRPRARIEPAPAPVTSESPAPAPAAAGPVDETIRVSVGKLDALMAQLSELFVTKIRAEQRLGQLRHVQDVVTSWHKEWLAVRGSYTRLARDRSGLVSEGLARQQADVLRYLEASQARLRQVDGLVGDLLRQYSADVTQLSLVIGQLEDEVKRVRMLPLSTITAPFGRMVRDLAREAGKDAALEFIGADIELDKRVLEQIKDPLIHLLRNAIDHGIELPDQRLAAGKPRLGAITLSAEQLGQDVAIRVVDDGAGLNMEAIRRAAVRQGWPNAQSLPEADLVEAIFGAGITTSPIITDISGRGIGLSVVRRNVEALHGRVDVEWKPGSGSTFTMILPLTLTSGQGLLVRAAGQLFVFPLNAVERILAVGPDDVFTLEGHETIQYAGRPVALVRLGDVLSLPCTAQPEAGASGRSPAVMVAAAERRMVFVADELVGEQELVIKGLGKQLDRVAGIAGATVVGTGEVVLILNVADLVRLAIRSVPAPVFQPAGEPVAPPPPFPHRRILIVDDSITTRTLEKNILEAVGYQVHLATDGLEALNVVMNEGVPDLVISDVLMPRMDGFELTRQLRSDVKTAELPIILVTSLDSPEDKAKGIEVGADAYIVKSGFDQGNLLRTIEQLI